MPRRAVFALLLGAVVAAVCVRLGIWQLERLAARRAVNDAVASRWRAEPVSLSELPPDTGAARYRRVRLDGTFDFDNELVLIGRSRRGSPGVHLVTPLKLDGSERAVLVNRGWVYSPDAAAVDLARWTEPARTTLVGYAQTFPDGGTGPARGSGANTWRRLDAAAIAKAIPYPIAPIYVVALDDPRTATAGAGTPGSAAAARPARLPVPELGEGSHRSYAFQWFSFAAIALVGGGILAWKDVKQRRAASSPVNR